MNKITGWRLFRTNSETPSQDDHYNVTIGIERNGHVKFYHDVTYSSYWRMETLINEIYPIMCKYGIDNASEALKIKELYHGQSKQ